MQLRTRAALSSLKRNWKRFVREIFLRTCSRHLGEQVFSFHDRVFRSAWDTLRITESYLPQRLLRGSRDRTWNVERGGVRRSISNSRTSYSFPPCIVLAFARIGTRVYRIGFRYRSLRRSIPDSPLNSVESVSSNRKAATNSRRLTRFRARRSRFRCRSNGSKDESPISMWKWPCFVIFCPKRHIDACSFASIRYRFMALARRPPRAVNRETARSRFESRFARRIFAERDAVFSLLRAAKEEIDMRITVAD